MYGPKTNKSTDRKWDPTGNGWIQANFDGARNKNGEAEIGVILRDDKGKIWASYVNNLHSSTYSDHVESMGTLTAVELAKSLKDIKSHLRGFRKSISTHIPRTGNSVAHALSRLAISMGKPYTWSGDTHQTIRQLVEAEEQCSTKLRAWDLWSAQCCDGGSPM
ncbi:hypothetical protein U1Q18_016396 [Sarracenia purpurea var. burkii]